MTVQAPSEPRPAPPVSLGLYRFALIFAAVVLIHIKWGAMVTSTGSGMAFTDWPLARGSFWPPDMDMADLFEHLHRIFGAVIGLMSLIMLVWIHRQDSRSWMIKTAWVIFLLIVAQGLLGGLGVLMGEEGGNTWAPASILHGIMAQPTLCLAAAIAFLQSPACNEKISLPADVLTSARKLCVFALVMVLVQLSIGSVVRHTNQQGMLWLHVFMALFVSTSILAATAYAQGKIVPQAPGFRRLCYWIMGTLLTQLVLGFVTLGARQVKDPSNIEYIGRSIIVSSHVVFGAFLFMLATLLMIRVWRVRPDAGPS